MHPYVDALWQTALIEYVILCICIRSRYFELIVVIFALECVTHPGMMYLLSLGYNVLLIEIFVVIIEATVYRFIFKFSFLRALGISLLANGLSYGLSVLY